MPWKKEMLPYELRPHGISKDPVKREPHVFFTPGRGPSQSLLLMSYIFQGSHGGSLLLFSLVSNVILHAFDLWNCTFLIRHMWEKQKGWSIWGVSGLKFFKPMCPPMHVHETIWCNSPYPPAQTFVCSTPACVLDGGSLLFLRMETDDIL